MTYSLINQETGEIVDVFEDGDSYTKHTKSQKDFLNRTTFLNSDRPFVKMFQDIVDDLRSKLTSVEVDLIVHLTKYLDYSSGTLYKSRRVLYSIQHLVADLKCSQTYAYRIMQSLCKNGVIMKCKTEDNVSFVMNPYICMKGNRINTHIVDKFAETYWAKKYAKEIK